MYGEGHLQGEREMTRKIERARRRGDIFKRWLNTNRNICHPWRDEKKRVRSTEA